MFKDSGFKKEGVSLSAFRQFQYLELLSRPATLVLYLPP
jgi:hypothetical protein